MKKFPKFMNEYYYGTNTTYYECDYSEISPAPKKVPSISKKLKNSIYNFLTFRFGELRIIHPQDVIFLTTSWIDIQNEELISTNRMREEIYLSHFLVNNIITMFPCIQDYQLKKVIEKWICENLKLNKVTIETELEYAEDAEDQRYFYNEISGKWFLRKY